MKLNHILLAGAGAAALVFGAACSPTAPENTVTYNLQEIQAETDRLNDWFEQVFQRELEFSPMSQTYLGSKDSYDALDDTSTAAAAAEYQRLQDDLAYMKSNFVYDKLDDQAQISWKLFEYDAERAGKDAKWREYGYHYEHRRSPHSSFPAFMMNMHSISSLEDAEAYISRLNAIDDYMGGYMDRAQAQYEAGIQPPAFVYPKIISSAENVLAGAPFRRGEDAPLLADFKSKIADLEITAAERRDLEARASAALTDVLAPTYQRLITMMNAHAATASTDDGAWKLPDGDAFYDNRLSYFTTTDLTADEIHDIGLKEVARIHGEMREIMNTVEFDGTLQEFFEFVRTDPQFVYENTDAGREAYMAEATAIIDDMNSRLDGLFITKPEADVVVKRVEPFREQSAGSAFYQPPSLDGSRPGTYYINLRDMSEQPIYQMQALAYHEGAPGHHMQIAIAQELNNIPQFRKQGWHTAYGEGWGLYSEAIPAELGLYTDPYKDFGRLSMEIFRAARLVVDTGIHSKKWTRQQALDYMMEVTPSPEGDLSSEIDRYIVWPGQATAYKIGMLKIQALRADAEEQLGDKFDVREFHDVVLANGSVPLSVLENLVEEYITEKLET